MVLELNDIPLEEKYILLLRQHTQFWKTKDERKEKHVMLFIVAEK